MNRDLSRYVAYKESEIEWIGEVPAHWGVLPLKDLASKSAGSFVDGPFGSDLKSNEYTDVGVPLIQLNNIGIGFHSLENLKFISEVKAISLSKHRAFSGEIAIAKMAEPVARATVISDEFPMYVIVADCMKFKPNPCISDMNFIAYALNTNGVKSQAEILSNGTTRIRINLGTTKTLKVVTPPLKEQKAIADYLDINIAQIDLEIKLLTQKETRYGKLKQSLINETVKCGLDKAVVMKDSGVEWIGEVPEHWDVKRMNDISCQNKNKNRDIQEKNLLSLSYGKIKRRDFETSFGLLPESFETYQIVNTGNIVLRLTDLQNDKRSLRVGLVNERGIITSAYLGLIFSEVISPAFAYYLLFIYDISKVFYWLGGGLRQSMKFDDIKILPFIVPPYEEQQAIANYLDTKTAHIDRIVDTINTQIDKLKELRKTLINDVVTGKIKVFEEGEAI
jgi:type I restriction enzyme S subunit